MPGPPASANQGPLEALKKASGIGAGAVQTALQDPRNWLRGEVPISPIRGALGAGQVLPTARDAVELIKRLQGGLSKVPTAASKLFQGEFVQIPAQGRAWMEKEFRANNPIFQALMEAGRFNRFK